MKRYRMYIDHMGNLRIVEVKRAERIAALKFTCYVALVGVASFLVLCFAAGLI